MPFIDTNALEVWERRPGWRGRHYESETMSFAYWDFAAGGAVHQHHHPNEEVWYIIEGWLEMNINGEIQKAGPGTAAIVPMHALHSVRALSDGRTIIANHPVRNDQPPSAGA